MNLKRIILFASLGMSSLACAQGGLGRISGVVYEANEPGKFIPIVRLWIETESGKMGTQGEIDGSYKIDAIKPGVYNLYAVHLLHDTIIVGGVVVRPDGFTTVDIHMTNENMMKPVEIIFNAVKIEKDIQRITLQLEDIENSPFIRDPKGLLVASTSDIQQVEGTGEMIIRGSRPGDAIYYIDGVKATDMNSIPGVSIQGIEAYTGGIPAKYGDTTGGVVILETKGYFDLYYRWKSRN